MADRPDFMSRPTGPSNSVGLDRSRKIAWTDIQKTETNQTISPSTDPTHSTWLHRLDLNKNYDLFYGRVVDALAYVHNYKVQLDRGSTTLWCSALVPTGLLPMGVRQVGQIPIGSGVIVLINQTSISGIIIGVIPDMQTASNAAMADFISQQSRCGLLVDSAHSYPLTLTDTQLITNWSAGRPLDGLTQGELGQITETGLLDFIDSFMTAKRVDEECGIWHFFHDQLTRVAGHNYQQWSAGYEREDQDDEGEVTIVKGSTPYYWEALGGYEYNTIINRSYSAATWQKDPANQSYAAEEPCSDELQAFYRKREFEGYLGQGKKVHLCLPPVCSVEGEGPQGSQCTPDNVHLLSTEAALPGVYEENLALTGRWAVRSAHEIILSKHLTIPTPKRIKLSEDPTGDNATDYKAAGILGSGDDHLIAGQVAMPVTTENQTQIRAAGFLDNHAFTFNWVGLHPFHYHTKDWYVPEEADLEYLSNDCSTPTFTPLPFDILGCQHFMPGPQAININVDHRYGDVKYYPNHSYFALLSDGGIVMGDGFGAEIKLANGHIWITAPGDVVMQAGRDVVNMAGYDFIAKAKHSWDITATNKDGRLQANKNLYVAATGDCGGVLIQSMATQLACNSAGEGEDVSFSGVIIKAENTNVSVSGRIVDLTLFDHVDSVLLLNAGWDGRIKMKGKYIERFINDVGSALDYWVTPAGISCTGSVTKGIEYWSDGLLIPNTVVVSKKLLVGEEGIFKSDIVSTEGHIGTALSSENKYKVLQLLNTSAYDDIFDSFEIRTEIDNVITGNTELDAMCDYIATFQEDCSVEFTFRTVSQYKTQMYVLFESRWQQMARIASVPTEVWTEQAVNDTYPYPGKEVLLGTRFKRLNPALYDLTTNLAANRGSVYENATYNVPTSVVMNSSYMVIV